MIRDNINRLHLWQGTRDTFRALPRYRVGGLYFVMDGQTAQSSEDGVIYLAIGAHQVVRFGSFSKETDIDAIIRELEEAIEGKQDLLTFDSAPTANSLNPVTSGGIYIKLTELEEMIRMHGGVTMEDVVNQIEEFAEVQIEALTANEVRAIWNSIEGHIYM